MHAVSYAIAAISLALGLLLYSCAHAEDAPAWAQAIMDETHRRVITSHPNWYAKDYRYVPPGEEAWGNCATFATTALIDAMRQGHKGEVIACGYRHVVARVDGWVLDAQRSAPAPAHVCEDN